MLGVIAAMLASLGWGIDAVLVRQGLRRISPALGTFVSLCTSFAVCLALLLVFARDAVATYPPAAFAWFGMIGIINFVVGRQCNFGATRRLGASRAASLFACSPLVSILLAVAFTGEQLSLPLLLGALLVFVGVVCVVTG